MYEYIRGVVSSVKSNYIVLENNNIGYVVYVGNPYSYCVGNEYVVYLYTHIKEDEHLLYGFNKEEEKELFLRLIGVKGLGPKMAMVILASSNIDGIEGAIDREDVNYLKKFPKIGDKVARQIILDLRGKLAKNGSASVSSNQELVTVLMNLGYKNNDIKRVVSLVDKNMSLEMQIKEALKLMLK